MVVLNDFDYNVPEELIAQVPAQKRDESRLLTYNLEKDLFLDQEFKNIPEILEDIFKRDVLIIFNNSKVYPARVYIETETGAKGEVFLLTYPDASIKSVPCLLRPQRRMKVGSTLFSDENVYEKKIPLFRVKDLENPECEILFENNETLLQQFGSMPLPPYIERNSKTSIETQKMDLNRYQNVYANDIGSCAAPTAGLHFSDDILEKLKARGHDLTYVTLHVGLGTFLPVKVDDIQNHKMHRENYSISKSTIDKIVAAQKQNKPVIFVGTTSLRCVESFCRAYPSEEEKYAHANLPLHTELFLYPQNEDDILSPIIGNGMVTNFHQPKSSLSMLISSLISLKTWKKMMSHAISKKYRLFSYGDASLLIWKIR